MYIQSLNGNILYEGRFKTKRRCVEQAVKENVDLSGANLRALNLRYAKLDDAKLNGACLWGADLSHADLAGAQVRQADLRATRLVDSCFAESNFSNADFKGALFHKTILRDGVFDKAVFSCPSVFTCPWEDAKSYKGAVYLHLGEMECRFALHLKGVHMYDIPANYNHRDIFSSSFRKMQYVRMPKICIDTA